MNFPVINSYNEWDPLEEVIVGVLDGASTPLWHITLKATMPKNQWDYFRDFGGRPFPQERIEAGKKDLEEFVRILEAEGVTVRRPQSLQHSKPFSTPDWQSAGGLYAAMPRDLLLVIGEEIIEAPMAWRSRYFEVNAYRPLLKEYFLKGAKWTSAPKPQLSDELYHYDYEEPQEGRDIKFVITEFEPTFDAADFIRCGKDIFVQRSHVTNRCGIEWLRRHLGGAYRIHELEFDDSNPMHIDGTFMPLAPGKLLVHPERVKKIPRMFKSWQVLYAPPPCIPQNHLLYMTSRWLNLNVLMLDEKRVVVEKHEEPLIRAFKQWGLHPILCPFRNFATFGGSFHCATLDVRRRGTLQTYF
jgi:glycine amidinotransferase